MTGRGKGVRAPGASPLQRFRGGYGLALEWVVMILMIALAFEVTLGIVFRFIGSSLVWYDEVASVLLAWLTFYGSALAFSQDEARHHAYGVQYVSRCVPCLSDADREEQGVPGGEGERGPP